MSQPGPILDVRAEASFAAGHAAGAVSIPLEQLARRTHELPPKGTLLNLFDDDPDRRRRATEGLVLRGYAVREANLSPADLWESGPSRGRLWQPSPFLVEALDRIQARPGAGTPGRALDVACGSGRDAVYLALCGYQVETVDVLPDALARARDLAERYGTGLQTIQRDLKRQPVLPEARYDLVTVFRFLHLPLMSAIGQSVAPGGFIVYETFHRRDPGRSGAVLRPGRGLSDGELAAAFGGFEPIIARDGLERGGRVLCQLLARRGR
jgi:SAM-dependent methyltransferase